MSLLKAEPPAPVSSLAELFAVAQVLEEEAASRYSVLADEMETLALPRVAAVFRHLAEEELGHARHVEEWAQGATGSRPDRRRVRWQPPETFDEEEARRMASSRLASAYRALSMAVRNEERAFAFWTYVAAQASAPEVRAAAERMASEELRHAALFRRERRRAYREEREAAAGVAMPTPPARAALAERQLAALLQMVADTEGEAVGSSEWRRLAAEAAALGGTEAAAGGATSGAPAHRLREARRWAEQAAEAYLDAADTARDEQEMERFQSLAEGAIARVAMLRQATDRGADRESSVLPGSTA